MSTRETAVSKSIEYETAKCTHCDEDVFVDSDVDNVDRLPEGVPVVVTGGDNMTVDTTSFSAAAKNYRVPKVVVKLFGLEVTANVERSYLCPACANSVYDFESDQ
ncbi:hypothetical protein [Natronoarchaeum rubrum]|uniref:hypothetical protein n=1 Tax=Natronoarchaeum rubrum TaxID=755311 RepID=UPI00211269BD|nr:hypothetical protein [Natronoarchaeum rubrum]